MDRDRAVLRRLAWETWQAAMEPRNQERRGLYRAVNDLRMIRPVVLMDEIPWHELADMEGLALQCEEPALREAESRLRRALFQYRHFPADMILPPYYAVRKRVTSSGIGLTVHENTLAIDARNHIISHEYHDQLQSETDLNKLYIPAIQYDEDATLREYERLGELFGDILPIRLTGIGAIGVHPWDDIARFRGVTNLLADLAERPAFMRALVERYVRIEEAKIDQYEALGLLDPEQYLLHCTPALTSALPPAGYDAGAPVTRKDVWGRGMAQIFGAVSKAMHEEFDIQYMRKLIGSCGLAYYGCCEPLDSKLDIVETIPNLRKVSITPWANVDIAAERISRRYVLSSKPNPAAVAVASIDQDALRAELTRILYAVRRNHCACDIVLKDISTCNNRLENLITWERTAMELAEKW